MKLTRDDVLKLARLSRLQLTDDEAARFQKEMSSILEYVEQLNAVDASGLKPTYQVTGLTSQDENATRPDEVADQVPQEALLKNLPATQDGHIKVKRMIS